LLYAGTETGLYISFNGGDSWERFQLNLPIAPVHDLLIKNNDLIAATHGRSFWILDDLTPLHQLTDAVFKAQAHLFKPRETERIMPKIFEDWLGGAEGKNYMVALGVLAAFTETKTSENAVVRTFLDAGKNPPQGVVITYRLKQKPDGLVKLAFLDKLGDLIREFTSKPPEADDMQDEDDGKPKPLYMTVHEGINRFVWDMRLPDVTPIETVPPEEPGRVKGPIVPPGAYQVQLTVGDLTLTESFDIIKDRRVTASDTDLQKQFDLWKQIYDKQSELHETINRLRDLRQQLKGWEKRAGDSDIQQAALELHDKLLEVEKEFLVPDLKPGWADTINHGIRLAAKLGSLPAVVYHGVFAPTKQTYDVFDHICARIDRQYNILEEILRVDLAAFNQNVQKSSLDAVIPQ
jgi:hypothetical protein